MPRIRIETDLEKSIAPGSLITTNELNDPKYLAPQANGDILSYINGQLVWSAGNENLAIPLAFNNVADFSLGHGSLVLNDKIYISTRIGGGVPNKSRLLCYPNCNDLSIFTFVDGPLSIGGLDNSMEAMCYDPITDKIIIPLSSTSNLFVVDPNNLSNFTIQPIVLGGDVLHASAPIMSDNSGNIYCFTESPTAKVIKLNSSTFTVLSTTVIPGGVPPHSGKINITDNKLYFTSTSGPFNNMDLNTNIITQLTIPTGLYTDDMCYIPADPFWANQNIVILGEEIRNQGSYNKGGVVIDADAMAVYALDLLPTYGIFYDPVTYNILSTSNRGFIEVIYLETILNLIANTIDSTIFSTDVYTFRGIIPNELLQTSCGYFATTWGLNEIPEQGHLVKLELKKVINPVITKTELSYRK